MLDVTGQKYNHLTAIKVAGRDKHGRATWLFRCDCGKEVVIGLNNVRTGNTKSCGCMKHKPSSKRVDITGKRYGRLTATKRAFTKNGASIWKCKCDCGNTCYVPLGKLQSGHTASCGCLSKEIMKDESFRSKWSHEIRQIHGCCAKCGSTSKLVVHHIYNRADYPKLSKAYGNGIVLCRDCHKEFHRIYGNTTDPWQLAKYLGLTEDEGNILDCIAMYKIRRGAEDIKKIISYAKHILKMQYEEDDR